MESQAHSRLSVAELLHHSENHQKRDHPDHDSSSSGPQHPVPPFSTQKMTLQVEGDKPKRKRRRVPVSCNICRHRKLKCDRQQPCSSCKQLRMSHLCQFESREEYLEDAKKDCTMTSLDTIQKINLENGGNTAAELAQGLVDPNVETQPINQLNKWGLMVSSAGVHSVPSGSWPSMPDSKQTDKFLKTIQLTNLDTLSTFSTPEKPGHDDAILATVRNIKLQQDDPYVWTEVLQHFPSIDVCEFLRTRFLDVTNNMFHIFTAESLRKCADDSRQIYLSYILRSRQPDFDPKSFRLTMPQVHNIVLVLLIVHLGYISMGSDWKTTDLPTVEHEANVGDGLRQLAMQAVEDTDADCENSLLFVQLLYYLTFYRNVCSKEIDKNGGFHDHQLLNLLVHSAYVNGLHRDPGEYEHMDPREVDMRRLLWRQVLFMDSYHALMTGRSPMIDLNHSNVDFEQTGTALPIDLALTRWSLIARKAMTVAILNPAKKAPKYILDKIEDQIASMKYCTASFPQAQQDEDANCANELFVQILTKFLQMRFYQSIAVDNNHRVNKVCLELLDIESKMGRLTSSYEHISSCLGIRMGQHAWYTLSLEALNPVNNLEPCLPVLDVETFLDVVKLLRSTYEGVAERASVSYFCWRNHVWMHSIMKCLKNELPPEKRDGMIFSPCVQPKDPRWLNWVVKEVQRDFQVVRIV